MSGVVDGPVARGKEPVYGLSRAFDAASKDIDQIYGILNVLKQRIAKMNAAID